MISRSMLASNMICEIVLLCLLGQRSNQTNGAEYIGNLKVHYQFKYLGVPLITTRLRAQDSGILVEKILD